MASILFVVPRFHTNLYFATLALIAAGHRVTLMAADGAGQVHDHLRPRVLPPGTPPGEIRAGVADAAPDLVFLRESGALSRTVEGATGRARVLHYTQHPLSRRASAGFLLPRWLRGRATERVTPVAVKPGRRPARGIRYLPLPVAALPTDATRPETGPLRVLCVGKLTQARKNHRLVIDALAEAGAAGRATLTLAGATAPERAAADPDVLAGLEAVAAASDWITIRRDLAFTEMPSLYAGHHVCVLPSVQEPHGAAPLEGMAYGTVPVISAEAGSSRSLTEGRDGHVVDVHRPGALRAVLTSLEDPAHRAALSAAALRTAATELSPETFVARVEALLPAGV